MKIQDLNQLLGLTNTDQALIDAISQLGGDVAKLSAKKMREEGSDFVNLVDAGVSLAFLTRAGYESDHATPRGAGPFVFGAAFYYPFGGSEVEAFAGPSPFADSTLQTREDALRAYGTPDITEEDDDEIDWDEWEKDGLQVRVSYKSDLRISDISVAVPMVDR